ncbi:hypothetical protein FNV43_RR20882 [Rhamnella rubrinervis]|uniref:Uncharacterized protein n=1 Tax=Rhamnella rubrinervis TaxID=2594499 RepID=A0A8K0DWT2_9ROSA|nr:hypothetical protein FNV43_RR20882 [Rhamnella rubrinervis]
MATHYGRWVQAVEVVGRTGKFVEDRRKLLEGRTKFLVGHKKMWEGRREMLRPRKLDEEIVGGREEDMGRLKSGGRRKLPEGRRKLSRPLGRCSEGCRKMLRAEEVKWEGRDAWRSEKDVAGHRNMGQEDVAGRRSCWRAVRKCGRRRKLFGWSEVVEAVGRCLRRGKMPEAEGSCQGVRGKLPEVVGSCLAVGRCRI